MTIEPGKQYVVQFANQRFTVMVIRKSVSTSWWWCKGEDGIMAMFPEAAFLQEISKQGEKRSQG